MNSFLLEAILLHHNKQIKYVGDLLHASEDNKEWVNVTGYSLNQLNSYLGK